MSLNRLKRVALLLSIVMLCFQHDLYAQTGEKNSNAGLLPDYLKLQYAGNIGMFSAGFGYSFFGRHVNTALHYGFVPGSYSAKSIHMLSSKTSFSFLHFKPGKTISVHPRAGAFITFLINNKISSFSSIPGYATSKLNQPNSIHTGFFVGFGLFQQLKNSDDSIELFLEYGTIGSYFKYVLDNSEIGFFDIYSLGLGLGYHF